MPRLTDTSPGDSPLIVIAMDGLSLQDLRNLARISEFASNLVGSTSLTRLECSPISSAQSIWSEIYTGLPWFSNGCPGYSRPGNIISDSKILTERDLATNIPLLAAKPNRKQVVVNMPLLLPADASRRWLSDGSVPHISNFSPANLSSCSSVASYRSRPFANAGDVIGDIDEKVELCLQAERNRLYSALELIEMDDWNLCLLRLSIFDQLSHIIGSDFLFGEGLTAWPKFIDFLRSFDAVLNQIIMREPNAQLCVVSAYSHRPCLARCNLNRLLNRGSLCQLTDNFPISTGLRKKQILSAAESMREASQFNYAANSKARAALGEDNMIDAAKTIAASPVSGAIYLNRTDRFSNGLVASDQLKQALDSIESFLKPALQSEFGKDIVFWTASSLGKNERKTLHKFAPEMMIHIDGVQFQNRGLDIVDRTVKPRSCHRPEGFVYLPSSSKQSPDFLTPIQLSEQLQRLMN